MRTNMTKVPSRNLHSTTALTAKDFADLLGTTTRDISRSCSQELSKYNLAYRRLRPEEREKIILQVLKTISSEDLSVAGDMRARQRWERGWAENLSEFSEASHDSTKLVPRYIRKGQPLRLFLDYVRPVTASFELNWGSVFRHWLFDRYLKKASSIYEFGCGSGINLAILAKQFPDKNLYGLDWSESSRRIVNKMADVYGWRLKDLFFNLFSPDTRIEIDENSAILTFSALEQTGHKFEKFLQFLLKKNPSICVHVEPIVEWYDENNLFDFLALMYHKRRGYLQGFLPRIRELESKGLIEIVRARRCYFGSLYTEGYSQIIWRPISRDGR